MQEHHRQNYWKLLINIIYVSCGVWIGWFFAILFVLNAIDHRLETVPIEDWSRMRELEQMLEEHKFLF